MWQAEICDVDGDFKEKDFELYHKHQQQVLEVEVCQRQGARTLNVPVS